MTNLELKNKLAEMLPEYEFNLSGELESNCIHGVKKLDSRTFRDGKKRLCKTNDRVIFISSEMYPDTDKNFRYAMNYTHGTTRDYRCKNWYGLEYKKVFVSGKTDELLLEEIKNQFT